MKTKKVFKFWTGWNTKKIENFLEKMAAEGWQLEETGFLMLFFQFKQMQPRKTSFSVDYLNREDKEYFSILEDAGWKLMGRCAGWHMWCQDYTEEKPEIYTDKQSLVDRSKRILWILSFALIMQIPMFITNLDKIIEQGNIFQVNNFLHVVFYIHIFLILILLGGFAAIYFSMLKIKKDL